MRLLAGVARGTAGILRGWTRDSASRLQAHSPRSLCPGHQSLGLITPALSAQQEKLSAGGPMPTASPRLPRIAPPQPLRHRSQARGAPQFPPTFHLSPAKTCDLGKVSEGRPSPARPAPSSPQPNTTPHRLANPPSILRNPPRPSDIHPGLTGNHRLLENSQIGPRAMSSARWHPHHRPPGLAPDAPWKRWRHLADHPAPRDLLAR